VVARRSVLWACVVVLLLLVSRKVHAASDDPINAVIGDESWVVQHGAPPSADTTEAARIHVHLAHVERRLRAADAADLSEAQRANRARALDVLAAYRATGRFPRRTQDAHEGRRPRFIDDRGVRCAVGEMIAGTGYPELAEAIDREHEYDYVPAMATEGLQTWAFNHGFSIRELAMIQPSYTPPPTRESARAWIDYEREHASLDCARDHEPPRRPFLVMARGDNKGNVTLWSARRDPFVRCFVRMRIRGGDAYERRPRRFRIVTLVHIEAPQAILQRHLDAIYAGDARCLPRPGPIPRDVVVRVRVGANGVQPEVSTRPQNADVERCLADHVAERLAAFGPGRWRLDATTETTIEPSMSDETLAQRLRSALPGVATDCFAHGAPKSVSVRVRAERDAEAFDIAVTDDNADFRTCVAEGLQAQLRRDFSVTRAEAQGQKYFRIDADATATEGTDVESPEDRDAREQRISEELERKASVF
jgi:hypothetical protein